MWWRFTRTLSPRVAAGLLAGVAVLLVVLLGAGLLAQLLLGLLLIGLIAWLSRR